MAKRTFSDIDTFPNGYVSNAMEIEETEDNQPDNDLHSLSQGALNTDAINDSDTSESGNDFLVTLEQANKRQKTPNNLLIHPATQNLDEQGNSIQSLHPKERKGLKLTEVPSHPKMGKQFQALGEKLGKMIVQEFADNPNRKYVFTPEGFSLSGKKKGVFDKFFQADGVTLKEAILPKKKGRAKKEPIADAFRHAAKNYDELVSTSTVRNLVEGLVKGVGPKNLKQGEPLRKYLSDVVEMFSDLRIETKYSGYSKSENEPSLGISLMQHTSPKGRVYHFKATSSSHDALDRTRRATVLHVLQQSLVDASNKKDVTSEDVFKNMAIAGSAFTLNYFTAPLPAENVFKHSGVVDENPNIRIEQTDARIAVDQREAVKRLSEALGGQPRGSTPQKATATWQKGLKNFDNPDDYYLELKRTGIVAGHSPYRQFSDNLSLSNSTSSENQDLDDVITEFGIDQYASNIGLSSGSSLISDLHEEAA